MLKNTVALDHPVVVFAECIYLQVDLLGVGGLIGDGSIDCLLEGEGEDGGDPSVVRGAHLKLCDGDHLGILK